MTDWHDFTADNGTPVAALHTPIVLLDRNIGSGTKTAGSAYFLGYPWLGAFQAAPGSATFGYTTSCGGSSTFSVSCSGSAAGSAGYQDISLSNSASVVADMQTCNAGTAFCIAVLSADNAPYLSQVSGANAFDFVSLDGTYVDTNVTGTDSLNDPSGAGSTFKNVILGSYPFYYQVSVQTLGSYTGNNAALEASLLPLLTTTCSADCRCHAEGQVPTAAPSILLDSDNLSALTASPTAGTVIETRGANSDSFPALDKFVYGATLTFNNDPL